MKLAARFDSLSDVTHVGHRSSLMSAAKSRSHLCTGLSRDAQARL